MDLERFPIEDVSRPWMSPEFCVAHANAEREKQRLLKRENKRQANRLLYSVPKKGSLKNADKMNSTDH